MSDADLINAVRECLGMRLLSYCSIPDDRHPLNVAFRGRAMKLGLPSFFFGKHFLFA